MVFSSQNEKCNLKFIGNNKQSRIGFCIPRLKNIFGVIKSNAHQIREIIIKITP
jgi:hypothetical protein